MKKYNFAVIGVAGYVAPRHLKAIKNLNSNLLISYDKSDNVGILDKFFSESLFFNNFDLFKKKFILLKKKIDFTVILTPNNTHYKYIKFALSNGSNVICEKPLVISPIHINKIQKLEKKFNRKVYTILQLRTLEVINKLKQQLQKSNKWYKVKVNYITPRGHWYQSSWKGDIKKSGGIIYNIGIHLLDALCYLFGKYRSCRLIHKKKKSVKGQIIFNNAEVDFYLSTNIKDLKNFKGKKVIRDFLIDKKKIDLAKNFEQAHTDTYKRIILKKDFDINTIKDAINLANDIQK